MSENEQKSSKDFAKRAVAFGNNLRRFWKEPPKGRYLNLKEILALGGASMGVSLITNMIQIYVTITKVPTIYDMGTKGTLHATIMYLTACVLALAFTPLWGRMIQRTKTKFGRYKPYILFVAPIVALFGVLAVWAPEKLTTEQKTIYMYLTCLPTIFIWNLWFNTWNMFPGVYTPNAQERADIWSPIGLVMGFAPTILNALNGVIIKFAGETWAARSYGLLCGILGFACVMCLMRVKERVFITQEESDKEKISTWQGIKMVCKNKPLVILTLALCLGCLKGTIDLSFEFIGRVKYATTVDDAIALWGGLSMIVGFAATPNMILLPWMTRKFNNRTIMIFWQACNTGAYLILACIGFQNFPQGSWSPYVLTIFRFVACFNAIGSLQPLMLSEIADYQQAKSGYRLEGFVQMMAYSLVLVVTQFALLIPALIQDKLGFNPANYAVEKDQANILSEELITIAEDYGNIALWISVGSGALMLICLIFYTLDKKKHAKAMEKLKESAVNADAIADEAGSLNMLENVLGDTAESAGVDTFADDILAEDDATGLVDDGEKVTTNDDDSGVDSLVEDEAPADESASTEDVKED